MMAAAKMIATTMNATPIQKSWADKPMIVMLLTGAGATGVAWPQLRPPSSAPVQHGCSSLGRHCYYGASSLDGGRDRSEPWWASGCAELHEMD